MVERSTTDGALGRAEWRYRECQPTLHLVFWLYRTVGNVVALLDSQQCSGPLARNTGSYPTRDVYSSLLVEVSIKRLWVARIRLAGDRGRGCGCRIGRRGRGRRYLLLHLLREVGDGLSQNGHVLKKRNNRLLVITEYGALS